MIALETVAGRFPEVAVDELSLWVERRWVRAERDSGGAWRLTEMDIARVRLLVELRVTLDVPEDLIPTVLSLIDQLYDARRTVRALLAGLDVQPAEIRDAVLASAAQNQPETNDAASAPLTQQENRA